MPNKVLFPPLVNPHEDTGYLNMKNEVTYAQRFHHRNTSRMHDPFPPMVDTMSILNLIFFLKLNMHCLHVLFLLLNVRLPFNATILHAGCDAFMLVTWYKNVHFSGCNKIVFTWKKSFHTKSRLLCNFVIYIFIAYRTVVKNTNPTVL